MTQLLSTKQHRVTHAALGEPEAPVVSGGARASGDSAGSRRHQFVSGLASPIPSCSRTTWSPIAARNPGDDDVVEKGSVGSPNATPFLHKYDRIVDVDGSSRRVSVLDCASSENRIMVMEAHTETNPAPSRVSALLVSDVRLYRESVECALGRRDSIHVLGAAGSISDAVGRVAVLDPDVIVVDVATRDSLYGIRKLAAAAPRSKIVAFAVDEAASDIPSYAEAGVAGYVPRDASIDVLVSTIESVSREESPCSPRVAGALFRHIAMLAATVPPLVRASNLSQREHEILGLIRAGQSNKDIARALTIEVATVKNHVHNLLQKLNVSTRAEASVLVQSIEARSRSGRA